MSWDFSIHSTYEESSLKILYGTKPPCCPVGDEFYSLEAQGQKDLSLGHIPQELFDRILFSTCSLGEPVHSAIIQ